MLRHGPLLPLALLLAGCTSFDPARDLPPADDWLIAVKSTRLPDGLPSPVDLAHHSWFDIRRGDDARWLRLEINSNAAFSDDDVLRRFPIGPRTARATVRWDHPVHLHGVLRGPEARDAAQRLLTLAEDYADRANYRGWPGPNSNTFVERLMRLTPGLDVDLHHNAIGKDYAPLLRFGLSASGWGVELETWLAGVQIGLDEGIEVHVLQMCFGLDLWPPAVKLPFLPRLGWPD